MRRRVVAGILCAVLAFGSTLTVSAEEPSVIGEFTEVADEEETAEEVVEDAAEAAGEAVVDEATEEVSLESYADISENLFFHGAISPEYKNEPIYIEVDIDGEGVVGADANANANLERELGVYLYEAIKNKSEYIYLDKFVSILTVSDYNSASSKVMTALTAALNEHPDCFYATGGYSYWTTSTNGGWYVSKIRPKYSTTNYDMSLLQERIDDALSVVKPEMTDLQKALALHDYIISVCEYDYARYKNGTLQSDHPDTYNMYGVLVDNQAVCQGYAETYKYLLNQAGVTAYLVSSKNVNHAWNMVMIDGELYQVDTTWDDPTWDTLGKVGHNYFLCSDSSYYFGTAHIKNYKDWVIYADYRVQELAATNTQYESGFWKKATSAMVLHEGYYYYATYSYKGSAQLMKLSAEKIISSSNTAEKVATITDNTTIGSNCFEVEGVLCFNSGKSIYSYDYQSGTTAKVFELANGVMERAVYKYGDLYYSDATVTTDPEVIVKTKINIATKAKYYVVFSANGANDNNISRTFNVGEDFTIPENSFLRKGYIFTGWNTAADGSGKAYAVGAVVKDIAAEGKTIILYAQWEINEYIVQYMGSQMKYNGAATLEQQVRIPKLLYDDIGSYIMYNDGKKVKIRDLDSTVSGDKVDVWIYTEFAVKDIDETYEIRFYSSKGKECAIADDEGKEYSTNKILVNVYDYLKVIASNTYSSYDTKTVNIAKALMDYGKCADTYFNGVPAVSNSKLASVTATTVQSYKPVTKGTADGITYLGSSLILESKTVIRHYFYLDEKHNLNDYSFTYVFGGEEDKVDAVKSVGGGIYYAEMGTFGCANFNLSYDLKFKNKNGSTFTMNYGIYSYAYEVLTGDCSKELTDLVKAMYLFGAATK